ncbi:ribonucleoside-diphosphate reductase subunit alpha [Rickettsia endosymbiont of Cardiosporidium cionae]|uniref:ribonucleoside-diphosphate reductase subunit alpha n=1 Tax=Rickettsia endosymbiont of Cardiosporidium cionae TaxID=2777155 RepID=UPI001895E19B|nr:ribonucleoside-diphosphate reductase subunit alpha [Rickettsia endosymbiont of Cardiosporidium cionae]KAF8818470.1 ribonucleoside-diphosphate reductase subunit alpha [Rickettsia endosymbiont of Cardiosporidium cionae]
MSNNKYEVNIDPNRNDLLSDMGKAILKDRYLLLGEDYQDLFARVATHYADSQEHAQRLYEYISNLWVMPATPILSNGGTKRGLPISCFINETNDSLEGILNLWTENVWLASKGGGIGSYWGNIRSINEIVGKNGKTSGIIPFIKVQDSMTLAISQGSLRRGSAAIYLPIHHPEIAEFIEIRRPTGGDTNRRALNIHHSVVITDDFMLAVENNEDWNLISPLNEEIVETVKARDIWIRLLTARIETGEPYILFTDSVNRNIPEHHKKLGLKVKTSNLCSEITLPTGTDHLGNERTAVCCLSSLNLEHYELWKNNKNFIIDIMRFLDNVIEDFIQNAPDTMHKAKYSAMRERSIGLGVMGLHSLLQSQNIPIESVMAKIWNQKIFSFIHSETNKASILLGKERGACPDAKEAGAQDRFSNKTAIAPTASISTICNNTSPGIEPYAANSFVQKNLTGSFPIKNKNLQILLKKKGYDTDQIWSSIAMNEGSVQHLTFLSEHEKLVYKTAYEIEQNWLIELAADRTPYISQSQSLNIFLLGNVEKQYLHDIHFNGWKKGIKSFYYLRSTSIQRADKIPNQIKQATQDNHTMHNPNNSQNDALDECLSCQ